LRIEIMHPCFHTGVNTTPEAPRWITKRGGIYPILKVFQSRVRKTVWTWGFADLEIPNGVQELHGVG
jgi:hypothetical protein